jgi:hypothetical protein
MQVVRLSFAPRISAANILASTLIRLPQGTFVRGLVEKWITLNHVGAPWSGREAEGAGLRIFELSRRHC